MASQLVLASNDPTLMDFYFPLDESSGSRYSAKGGYTLADNATVTSAAGKMYTNAASFARASSEYLSHAGDAVLRGAAAGWWRAGWFYLDTLPGATQNVVVTLSGNDGMQIHLNSTPALAVTAGTGAATATDTHGDTLVVSTWYFWYVEYDGALLQCSINAGSLTAGTSLASFSPGSAGFKIGASNTPDNYFNGRMQGICGGDGVLSSDQITALYNLGLGATYPSALMLPSTVCNLLTASDYVVPHHGTPGLGAPEARRVWSPRWKYGFDELDAVSYGNRTAELAVHITGTTHDDLITNYNNVVAVLADAERYRESGGGHGKPATLTVQVNGQTSAVVYDVLGGELDAHNPFTITMFGRTANPYLLDGRLRLHLKPFARPYSGTVVTSSAIDNGGGTAGGNLAGTYSLAAPAGQFDAPLRFEYRSASGDTPRWFILGRRTRGNTANFIWVFECENATYTGYTVTVPGGGPTHATAAVATAHNGNVDRISNILAAGSVHVLTFTLTGNIPDFYGEYAVFIRIDAASGTPYALKYQLKYGGASGTAVEVAAVDRTAHLSPDTLLYLGTLKIPDRHVGVHETFTSYLFTVNVGGWSATGATTLDLDCVYLVPVDEAGFTRIEWSAQLSALDRMTLDDTDLRPWTGVLDAARIVQPETPSLPFARTRMRAVPGVANLWLPLAGRTILETDERVFNGHDLTDQFTLEFAYHPLYGAWR